MEAVAASDRVCTRRSLGGVGSVATAAGAACLNRNPSRRPVALREHTTRPAGMYCAKVRHDQPEH